MSDDAPEFCGNCNDHAEPPCDVCVRAYHAKWKAQDEAAERTDFCSACGSELRPCLECPARPTGGTSVPKAAECTCPADWEDIAGLAGEHHPSCAKRTDQGHGAIPPPDKAAEQRAKELAMAMEAWRWTHDPHGYQKHLRATVADALTQYAQQHSDRLEHILREWDPVAQLFAGGDSTAENLHQPLDYAKEARAELATLRAALFDPLVHDPDTGALGILLHYMETQTEHDGPESPGGCAECLAIAELRTLLDD